MKQNKVWTLEQKKEALWLYIKQRFNTEIPRVAICSNHQSPFDFVAAAFFELYDVILALANRNGGKTIDFAILGILDALADDDSEGANFGAIEKQALRCYNYIKRFLEDNPELNSALKEKPTLGRTTFKNKSWLQVLVATIAGVNSPHPQKLKADEVELIAWPILQEALSMPNSKGDIKATTILGSTRKYAHGPMQRLIDEKIAKVFSWCVWETMEPWPTDLAMQQKIKDIFIQKFGDLELLPKDLTKFTGFFKWADLITRVRTLDIDTFLAQWMCQKPDSSGLIYPKFDDVLNLDVNFKLSHNNYRSIQIWEDFGYAKPDHPDAIGLVAVDVQRMEFTIFDELWLFEKTTQDIIIEVVQMLQRNNLVDQELLEKTQQDLIDYKPKGSPAVNYAEFFTKIDLWVPDYHGLTEIADRKKYGCPIKAPKVTHESIHGDCQIKDCPMADIAKLYLKENGIPHVRNFVDERRFKYTPNVVNISGDFMSYEKKKRPDGTRSDEPEKKNDHGPDLVHYGSVFNWPNLAYQAFSQPASEETSRLPNTTETGEEVISDTYTGDIMGKTF